MVKDSYYIIGKILVSASILIGAYLIAQAIQAAGGAIGSQIASAIALFGG